MKRKISRTIFRTALPVLLWGVVTHAMAQNCQVVTSRPEIQLNQRYTADRETLFTQQVLTVTVTCRKTGPVSVRVDGTPDQSGKHFRFGEHGRMTLMLLSAQYNNSDTALTVMSPARGTRRFMSGQTEPLSPGSQLTVQSSDISSGSETPQLTLQMQLDFPASGDEGRIREQTEMSGQLRFEAVQPQ